MCRRETTFKNERCIICLANNLKMWIKRRGYIAQLGSTAAAASQSNILHRPDYFLPIPRLGVIAMWAETSSWFTQSVSLIMNNFFNTSNRERLVCTYSIVVHNPASLQWYCKKDRIASWVTDDILDNTRIK